MIDEALDIIADINGNYYEATQVDDFFPATIEANGVEFCILYLGSPIFQSGADSLADGQSLTEFVMAGVDEMNNDMLFFKNSIE